MPLNKDILVSGEGSRSSHLRTGYILSVLNHIMESNKGKKVAVISSQKYIIDFVEEKFGNIVIGSLDDLFVSDAEVVVLPTTSDLDIVARKIGLKNMEELIAILLDASFIRSIYIIHLDRVIPIKYKTILFKGLDIFKPISPYLYRDINEVDSELDNLLALVKHKWGFDLRPYQVFCIKHILLMYTKVYRSRQPFVVVILPTGSGKSVIFQSIALYLNKLIGGTTIVLSPLLALIEDHVRGLKRRGIDVCRLDGTTPRNLREKVLERIIRGECPIAYITPEQFIHDVVERILWEGKINYIIFDEAHCISRWGRSFRPSYLFVIDRIREMGKKGYWVPIALFTATLSEPDLKYILREFNIDPSNIRYVEIDLSSSLDNLEIEIPAIIKGPIIRENIGIYGEKCYSDKKLVLAETLRSLVKWSNSISKNWIGIVFAGFVKSKDVEENAENIARFIEETLGFKTAVFHGQLDKDTKEEIIDTIYSVSKGEKEEPKILVATKAFGMGVDIPNIRFIVHYIIPSSIEDYYQEIGRAGRDGLPSKALLIYRSDDIIKLYKLLRLSLPSYEILNIILRRLYDIIRLNRYVEIKLSKLVPSKYIKDSYSRERVEKTVEHVLYILARNNILRYDIEYMGFDRIIRILSVDTSKIRRYSDLVILIYRSINEWLFENTVKLEKMRELSELITGGHIDRAIRFIDNYFKRGIVSLVKDYQGAKKKVIRNNLLRIGSRIEGERGSYRLYINRGGLLRRDLKSRVSLALALGIAYISLNDGLHPFSTLVFLPYGYRKQVIEYLSDLERTTGLATYYIPSNITTYTANRVEKDIVYKLAGVLSKQSIYNIILVFNASREYDIDIESLLAKYNVNAIFLAYYIY